jgi:hypothetical protein
MGRICRYSSRALVLLLNSDVDSDLVTCLEDIGIRTKHAPPRSMADDTVRGFLSHLADEGGHNLMK